MSDRRLRMLAWSVLGALVTVMTLSVVLVGPDGGFTIDFVIGFGLSMTLLAVAAWLTLRVPRNPVTWTLLVSVMSAVLAALASDYLSSASGQGLPLARVVFFIQSGVFWVGIYLMTVLFMLLFPTGRPPTPRWWWVALVGLLGLVVQLARATYLAVTLPISRLEDGASGVEWFDAVVMTGQGMVALSVVAALVSFAVRFYRSTGVERQQLKTLLVPFTALASFWIIESISQDNPISMVLLVIAVGTLPMAIGVAILRYRLFDIDRIISRTVTYTLVVAVLAATYFGVVTLVTTLLPTQDALAVAGATLTSAYLFNPLRKRIQHSVNRRFNRSAYQVEVISEQFTSKLRESLTTEELVQVWTNTVVDHLQPARSGVWLTSHQSEARRP